ncbi:class I SAM-dependent methyltransferase [Streptomyces profundus]|uniref:class I SAM-dependent methyltransferase n=1 Tax=Streptomyces profundus TaxID=2867410 RepID=UPI001D16E719|nr:class I SAM-dependent methyltransferase [Streptomyces sp. MA3_2.13]UED87182.1 class I SAM-dependent methyltransferase [Streptomyces sp. MA3_2.13]
MDDRHHPPRPGRRRAAERLIPPSRLELTRRPGVGPDASLLGDLTGALVVELGCGSGHNLAHLTTRGAHCIGIDRDPFKVHRARTLYGHLPRLRFRHGDASDQLRRLPTGSADVCLSIFGAFSFVAPRPLLAATANALRPGGQLLIVLRADDHHDYLTVLTRR